MPLAVTVTLLVLGITVMTAVVGYLIDRSAARNDRREGR